MSHYIIYSVIGDLVTLSFCAGKQPDRGDDRGRPEAAEAEGGGEGEGEGGEEEIPPTNQKTARGTKDLENVRWTKQNFVFYELFSQFGSRILLKFCL